MGTDGADSGKGWGYDECVFGGVVLFIWIEMKTGHKNRGQKGKWERREVRGLTSALNTSISLSFTISVCSSPCGAVVNLNEELRPILCATSVCFCSAPH